MTKVINKELKGCVAMTLKVPCPFGTHCIHNHKPEAIPAFTRKYKAVGTKILVVKKRPSPEGEDRDEDADGEDHASRDAHKFPRGDKGGGKGRGKGGGKGGRS
jgi:hypothetical protein